MLRKNLIFTFLVCGISTKILSQNPNTITFPSPTPNPPNLAIDSYTRAATKINLQPGSKYGFITGNATNLLNLSLGTYPPHVNSNYVDTSAANNPISVNPNLELGITDGSGNVNSIGALNYHFPIYCPPGLAGIQPNLTISYNSNASISSMGLGFNLSGISSISRTNKTHFYDGGNSNKAINLNNLDVFALDGNRLLLKTGVYGQNGATYKTEVENYSKIISLGTNGSGPNSFIVHTPEGKTLEFGNSPDSKLKAANNNEILSWYLNKVTDQFGNYMLFFYDSQNGEINIDRIEYTGNINAGLNPYNKIKFEYIDRSDKNKAYFGGGVFNQTKILKRITGYDNTGGIVKKYVFDYQYNHRSLLSKITEVDANGNQLNPTNIDWTKANLITNQTGGFAFANNIIFARHAVTSYTYFGIVGQQFTLIEDTIATANGSNLSLIPADLNGDGKKDLLSIDCIRNAVMPPPLNPNFPVMFPTTFVAFISTLSAIPNQQNNFIKITNPAFYNTQTISNDRIEILATNVYDEDYDNIDEVFITRKSSANSYVIEKIKSDGINYTLSTLQGPKPISNNNMTISGWPGIGLMFNNFSSMFVPSSPFLITKADITGDNILDEIIVDQVEIKIVPSNGQPPISYPVFGIIRAKIGDFNGDGVSEIYMLTANGLNCPWSSMLSSCDVTVLGYNNGNNSLNVLATKTIIQNIQTIIPNCGSFELGKYYETCSQNVDFADFNEDGKTDVVFNIFTSSYINNINPGYANFVVSNSTGSGFTADQIITTIPTKIGGFDAAFFAADVNNDGKTDWNSTAFDNSNFISHFNVYPSNGNSIEANAYGYSKSAKFASALGDFDGNGTLDYLSQSVLSSTSSIEYSVFNRNNKQFVNRIHNIKTDYKIDYSLLVNNKSNNNYPLYKKSSISYPNIFTITKLPLFVVVKTTYNSIEKDYAYENAVLHQQNKGFLGFEKVYMRDIFSNLLTVESYTYDATFNYVKSSSALTGYANLNPNTFPSINTNSIISKSVSDLNYVVTGNNRYLANRYTENKDYIKSANSYNFSVFDNSKDGKLLSETQYSTPWNSTLPHIVENSQSITYINVTNPLSGNVYFKPLKIINTKIDGVNGPSTSSFDTDFTYDVQGHLITKVENSNVPNFAVTSNYSGFNNFGNATQIILSAPDLPQPRTVQYVYDVTGRFITKSTNAIGNFEEYSYETKFGNKVLSKSITGLITTMQYDGLGRLIKTILPSNAVNTVDYEWYSYNFPANPSQIFYSGKITSKIEGSPTLIKKYDINDNVVEINEEVFGAANKITQTTYNIINQPLSEKELATINPNTGAKEILYTYDPFLRYNTLTNKVGNNTLSTVTFSYNAISTDAIYNKGFTQLRSPNSNAGQFNFVKNETNTAGQNDKKINFSSAAPGAQHTSNIKYNQYNLPFEISNSFPSANAIVTTISYDALGRRQQLNDPSSGISSFQYNSINELLQQTTPNGSYVYTYDVLGRTVTKNSNNNSYTYQYITAGSGKQMLSKIIGSNETTDYKYDNLNRLTEKKQTITAANNKILQSNYTYDKYGKILNYTYPSGFTTTREYDGIGTLIKIKNNNTVIWQLNALYTPNLISQYTYGNGLINTIAYDANQNLQQKAYGSVHLQNYDYAPQNNDLLSRDMYNLVNFAYNNENFTYDEFNRLTDIKYYDPLNILQNKANVTYNQNGNIASKSDAGNYVYGQLASPYQLTNVNNQVGNISLNTLNVSYNDFKKVSQINEANTNKQYNFIYGNDENRIKMEYLVGGTNQYTRFYTDNYDRQETGNNNYKEWNYIYAPTGLAAIYYKNNGNGQLLYACTDNLGSVTMLTNANGAIVEEYSFDSWGRKRKPSDWNDYTNVVLPTFMIRGFTMHEHLNEVGIINMNGRVYDPVLGRFLQPDILVQDPNNLQTYNRYTYALNNPLKFTDPSGYNFEIPYYTYTPMYVNTGVPSYYNYNYNYSNAGYGGINSGYGYGYSNSYSGNYNYGGYSGSYNYSNSYSAYSNVSYNPNTVTYNYGSSSSYNFSGSYGNASASFNYSQGYSGSISYPNYNYQAKLMVDAVVSNAQSGVVNWNGGDAWYYSIPVIGPALESGHNLEAGNYGIAFATFGMALVDLFFFGEVTASKVAANTAAKGGTNVYRAVDAAELAVIKSTGRFSLEAGGVEAKYFAKSKTSALVFGEKIYGADGYTVVRGVVSDYNILSKYWFPGIDAFKTFRGGAYVVPPDALNVIIPVIR